MRSSAVAFMFSTQLCITSVYAQSTCPSPNVNDVLKDPVVMQGMIDAWNRSFVNGQAVTEDGFAIYQCRNSINSDYSPPVDYVTELEHGVGHRHHVDFSTAVRTGDRCRIVALFHTHPDDESILDNLIVPLLGGDRVVEDEPSGGDQQTADGFFNGVPDAAAAIPSIILYKQGFNGGNGPLVHFEYGPEVRPNLIWSCPVSSGNSSNNAPSPQPASTTDPHLITLDGLGYDFHGIGEFVLLISELGNLEIQARQQRYGGPSSQVAVNTGFAFNVDDAKVSIVRSLDNDAVLYIDDEEQISPTDVSLSGGGGVNFDSGTLTVTWSDGSRAVVSVRSSWMNLSLAINSAHAGRVSGLLGNYDNEKENDIVTRSGDDLSISPAAKDLYGVYADGWRVSYESSQFHYFQGQDTETFTNRLFPGRVFGVSDLTDQQRQDAKDICEGMGVTNELLLQNCILDVAVSGDAEFAEDALLAQDQLNVEPTIVEVQGEIGVPSRNCDVPAEANDLEGLYSGTLTNPDINIVWDLDFELAQCGDTLYGLSEFGADQAFGNRLFEGIRDGNELQIDLGYPYNFDFSSVGSNTACDGMRMTLASNGSMLSGIWTSPTSGCSRGGEVSLLRFSDDEGDSLYLNIQNISVAEGENSTPMLNNTVSLNNVIDAATADSVETHSQATHIWHTGTQLELMFDFGREYLLEEIHFWNYSAENFDVDNVELSFSDSTDTLVGGMSLSPQLGRTTATESEDFDVVPRLSTRYVRAIITGSNSESDFLNMGFTVKAP